MQESDSKAPSDMAVLRQPQQGLGTRRLPGLHGGAAAQVAEPPARSHTLDSLRSAFAAELALLADEARQEGLATARQAASKALAEQQQEQSRQWQKKESALRLALEQEQQRLSELASHAPSWRWMAALTGPRTTIDCARIAAGGPASRAGPVPERGSSRRSIPSACRSTGPYRREIAR